MIKLQLVDLNFRLITLKGRLIGLLPLLMYGVLLQHLPKYVNTWIYVLATIPLIAFTAYYFITINKVSYKFNGTLSLDDSKIVLNRDNEETVYILSEVQNVRFVYHSAKDLVYLSVKQQISLFWVEIVVDGNSVIFDYVLENSHSLRGMLNFLQMFKNKDNVTVYNHANLGKYPMNNVSNKESKHAYCDLIDEKYFHIR